MESICQLKPLSLGAEGGDVGRAAGENAVFVPSDATLARQRHASVEHRDGRFLLVDCTSTDFHAAVSAAEWLHELTGNGAAQGAFWVACLLLARPM